MRLTLEIEKVAHGGVFVARDKGQVFFVAGALPGEKVEVEITESAKSFSRAEVVEVLEPSEHRVPHFWKAAAKGAGGAEFGHISLDYQRELKSQVLRENLSRMAKVESDVEVEAVKDDAEMAFATELAFNSMSTSLV